MIRATRRPARSGAPAAPRASTGMDWRSLVTGAAFTKASPPSATAAPSSSSSPSASSAARPSYGAPTPGDLARFRKAAPVDSRPPAHLHPNCHPAWQYASPRDYGSPARYSSVRAEDARVTYARASTGGGGRGWFGGGGGRGGGGGGGGGWSGNEGWGGLPWPALTVLFAALVGGGGLAAYRRKGSRASLEAGAALAAVLLAGASLMGARRGSASTWRAGNGVALAAAAVLAAYMGQAYSKSGKTMPHGALAAVGAAFSAGYAANLVGAS